MNTGSSRTGMSRREFVKMAAVAGTVPWWCNTTASGAAPGRDSQAETAVRALYETLSGEQKKVVVLPWNDKRRRVVSANWEVTEASVGKFFNADQQELIKQILKSVTSEGGYKKFSKQMAHDWAPGLANYTVAIFGQPQEGPFQFELTGRHLTLRADGNSVPGAAFGGPIVYGHAPEFDEKPGHPGNVFWYQAQRANQLFQALDGKQRKLALLDQSPDEEQVQLRKASEPLPGISGADLSHDQKQLLSEVLADILEPYRQEDVDEVMHFVKAGGGLDKMTISYYRKDADGSTDGDIGQDGVWDIWRVESPTLVCHFRGSPHIHAYINVGRRQN